MRRKVLQDGDANDGVDNEGAEAMEVGEEADSQVSHKLRRMKYALYAFKRPIEVLGSGSEL